MTTEFLRQIATLALAPARLAGKLGGIALRGLASGGDGASAPMPSAPTPSVTRTQPDDADLARRIDGVAFRGLGVDKRKVDVEVSRGAVRLRGEVRTLGLRDRLAARTAEVPGVLSVENLLHLPPAPARRRSDTPASKRRTSRPTGAAGRRKAAPKRKVNAEAPPPANAEPTPKQLASRGKGRQPAPLGSKETPNPPAETQGPDAADLDKDPAYQPTDPGLRKLKGG